MIAENPKDVYCLDPQNHRLLIHYLCEKVEYPDFEDDAEISDDEDDEIIQIRKPPYEVLKKENKKICDLAMFLIETSLSIGPTWVATPLRDEKRISYGEERYCGHEVHESILTVRDLYGKTPLHVLCEQSADYGMMKVIFDHTRENSAHPCAPTAYSLITSTDDRRSTPLHYLSFSRECPMSSLRLMMDHCKVTIDTFGQNQDPTLCEDEDGETPLHWALEGYMSPRRIEQLLRYSRAAVGVRNYQGNFPLDGFANNFVDSEWRDHDVCGREAWGSIQAYLKVLVGWDVSSEWLPLHTMANCTFNLPLVFYDIALHYAKVDVSRPDGNGWFPLHLACRRRLTNNVQAEGLLARQILKSNPLIAFETTADTQQLPIHLAIRSQKPWSLLSALLSAYPISVKMVDPQNGLLPFLLAGTGKKKNIDTSYRLLKTDPSIIKISLRKFVGKKQRRALWKMNKLQGS